MRFVPLLCLTSVAVTACTAWNRDDEWPEPEAFDRERVAPTVAREGDDGCPQAVPKAKYAIDDSLAIDLERTDAGAIEPRQWMQLRARIRNAGTSTRKVVLPSDGSEVGWREPHVWFTAYVQEPGSQCAIEVPQSIMARCGLFDHEWHDDVVELDPGDARDLEWLGNPAYSLDLAAMPEGTVTLFLHYAFTAGVAGKGGSSATPDLGPMTGEPAFEVVSNPIVMQLRRPLVLELVPRSDRAGTPTKASDLFTLTLRNVSDAARSIASADASRLRLEVVGTQESWPQGDWRDGVQPAAKKLRAGASMELALEGFRWVHPKPEKVRVRAFFRPYAESGKESIEVASAWVEIDLAN